MKPFLPFESRLVPMPNNNIDTDQIIPARFLKTTSKEGLDKQLFCDWRYDAQGKPKPDFILNQPSAQGACSREEPQPKLRPATNTWQPAASGRFSAKSALGLPSGP